MKRSKAHSRFKSDLAFLDMLFNMTLAFAFLFLIAFLLINPPAPTDPGVKLKAEYVITMSWPDEVMDDIDLWLMAPDGEKIMYKHRDGKFITLDRDDRGGPGDIITDDRAQTTWIKSNREMMTIRAVVPGRYVVACHVFSIRDNYGGVSTDKILPYPVKLEMIRLNPRLTEVGKSEVTVTAHGEERVFFAFIVHADGNVTLDKDADDSIVGSVVKE